METAPHDVLIVTYYWPPAGGPGVQRYLKFAKYLPRYQVRPVILTVSNPTYPIRDESLREEIPPELKVYRTRTVEPFRLYAGLQGKEAESVSPATELKGSSPLSKIGSWIRANLFIPDARVGWLLTARRKALEIVQEHRIATVITTGPPHSVHFVGHHLQREAGVRWFADFRDPWSGIYYNQLLPRTDAADHFDRELEKRVLSRADEVIVVSRAQAEDFREIHERGYRVIPNGFDPDDFPERELPDSGVPDSGRSDSDAPDSGAPDSSGPNDAPDSNGPGSDRPGSDAPDSDVPDSATDAGRGRPAGRTSAKSGSERDRPLLMRHIGTIGEAAIPRTLLTLLKQREESLPIQLEFIGDVHRLLPRLIRQLNLKHRVRFTPYLPHRQAIGKMCSADLLLLALPDVPQIDHHIPGKLFEYLGSGRPILMLGPTGGEAASILKRLDAGVAAPFDDEKAISQALTTLSGRTVDQPQLPPDPVNHPYSRVNLTRELAQLIQQNE